LNTLFFKDAHICLLVFDITRKESFNNIRNFWYESIITNGPEGVVFGLAGNKNDLSEYEKVDRNEVKEFCEEINAVFKYTSAKNNVCIDELFKELGYKFLHSEFMKDMSISLSSLSDSKDKILIDEKNKEKEINWEKIGCC
jgi:GTPase SAR1 family protein